MEKLTRNQEKLIRSLQRKKGRKEEGMFVVEGEKMVRESLDSEFKVHFVAVCSNLQEEFDSEKTFLADEVAMNRVSTFKTPPGVLAVVELRTSVNLEESDLILVLDHIQDPGNLGTIIRTADAFGVKTIVCSLDTVDCYSPKVVQATMGSIFRMNIHYLDLDFYLSERKRSSTIYAAHLEGENIYQTKLEYPATLLIGNESNGVNSELMKRVNTPVKIPIEGEAESFNASIATAIILGEFKRQLTA